jgi:hypothetical protein
MRELVLEFPISLAEFETRLQQRSNTKYATEQNPTKNINVVMPTEVYFTNWPTNLHLPCWACGLTIKNPDPWFIPYVYGDDAKTRFTPRGIFCYLPCLYDYYKRHMRAQPTLEAYIRFMIDKRRGRLPDRIIAPPPVQTSLTRYQGGGKMSEDDYRAAMKQIEQDMFY